jgi:hypothetical protein
MSTFGFVVIVILYATIGLTGAAGAIFLIRQFLAPKGEQIFYGLFLILIAAFYLAFAAYFKSAGAWRVEVVAVVLFSLVGLFGIRLPIALIVGYPLHGLWDLLHELQAHGAWIGFQPEQLTAIPLAYGIFCLAFDVCMAGYFHTRRDEWEAAWRTPAAA